MADDPNYSYFSTQYVDALVRFHFGSAASPADRGFWFGRLTDYPYEIQNFHSPTSARTGLEFWGKLVRDELMVSRFVLTTETPVYEVDPANPANRIVNLEGELDYEMDGNTYKNVVVKYVHYLRPTWVATKTVFTYWS